MKDSLAVILTTDSPKLFEVRAVKTLHPRYWYFSLTSEFPNSSSEVFIIRPVAPRVSIIGWFPEAYSFHCCSNR